MKLHLSASWLRSISRPHTLFRPSPLQTSRRALCWPFASGFPGPPTPLSSNSSNNYNWRISVRCATHSAPPDAAAAEPARALATEQGPRSEQGRRSEHDDGRQPRHYTENGSVARGNNASKSAPDSAPDEASDKAPLQLTDAAVRGLAEFTCLAACVHELQGLVPSKVDGVVQSEACVVGLRLRTAPKGTADNTTYLYLSWRPEAALLCTGPSPGAATSAARHYPFGQQLQAELQGLVLQTLMLPQEFERVVLLAFGQSLSAEPTRFLFFESQGNRSNLLLTRGAPGLIPAEPSGDNPLLGNFRDVLPSLTAPGLTVLAAAKGIGVAKSALRQLQVGSAYSLPPPQAHKRHPGTVLDEERSLQEVAVVEQEQGLEMAHWLTQTYRGLGPTLAAQLCRAAGLSPSSPLRALTPAQWEALLTAWAAWVTALRTGRFTVLREELQDGGAISPLGLRGQPVPGGMNAAMRAGLLQANSGAASSQRQRLAGVVRGALKRSRGKLAALEAQQAAGEKAEATRKRADLIMGHLHLCTPGAAHVEATDWETGEAVRLELDPATSAVDQAEALYKQARRQGRTPASIRPIIEACQAELEYLAGCESQLEQLGDDELQEGVLLGLQEELVAGRYMKPPSDAAYAEKALKRAQKGSRARKGEATAAAGAGAAGGKTGKFRHFTSPGGLQVLVGRNNRENDELTHRVAAKTDLWFHARGFPGSHAVLRVPAGRDVTSEDVQFAADLAAHFSKARAEGKVYAVKAFVADLRKPKGAHPGQVLVTRETSVLARPQAGRQAAEKGGAE